MSEFDDLINDFLGNGRKQPKKLPKSLEDFMKLINNLASGSIPVDGFKTQHEKQMGPPDRIETFEENGFKFERKFWETESGTFISVEMVEHAMDRKPSRKPITGAKQPRRKGKKSEADLKREMDEAVKKENYEEAARLRDELSKLEKPVKPRVRRKKEK